MPLVTTKEVFKKAYEGGYAVGAFNIDNMEILKAVLRAAENKKSPVMIAISSGSLSFIGENHMLDMIKTCIKDCNVPVTLHLDHGKNVEICKKCVDLGFNSVMIDASSYEYEENIKMTKEVVEYAHAHGVVVESELGSIAGIEEDLCVDDKYGAFTHPDQVVDFVTRTGIDSLAIAIGTAHGAYKFKPGQKPQLRFDILEEIEEKLPGFPLVLHGASSVPHEDLETYNKYGGELPEAIGIPEDMLRKAASKAVCKINVATDVRVAFSGAIRKAMAENPAKFEPRVYLNPAMDAVTKLVEYKMEKVLGSANKA